MCHSLNGRRMRLLKILYVLILIVMSGCSKKGPSELAKETFSFFIVDNATDLPLSKSIFVINDSIIIESNEVGKVTFDMTPNLKSIQITSFPYLPKLTHINSIKASDIIIRLDLPPKLNEYQKLLTLRLEAGYTFYTIEEYWDRKDIELPQKLLVMRHDVDYTPLTAAAMAIIEFNLGIRASYYFRWSTADQIIVKYISSLGHEIGLHYETIANYAKKHNLTKEQLTMQALDECRLQLQNEIFEFERRFGDISSIASHGDVWNINNHFSNYNLLSGRRFEDFAIKICASYLEMYLRYFDAFIGDSGGKWAPPNYQQILAESPSRLYLLVHPDYWKDDVKYSFKSSTYDYYFINYFYDVLESRIKR